MVVLNDSAAPAATLASPANGNSVTTTTLISNGYLDVTFTDDFAVVPSSITDSGAEFTLTGAAASSVTVNGAATLVSRNTYRYTFTGTFAAGAVGVEFTSGTWSDYVENSNSAISESFTVVAAPDFEIVVIFPDSSLTTSQKAVFTSATARWAEIIIGDLPDVNVSGYGVVDDVVIEATAPFIDGPSGILGSAGPTSIRSGTYLPAYGIMRFDSADVANMVSNGSFENVILHEMGHVLGIGTIWSLLGLLDGKGTSDPRFNGVQATAEYNSIFGTSGSSVPVGNTGGSGTRDAHWRESTFNNELMTGYINSGSNPISRVTVASLADMGYLVNINAADAYTPPSSSVAPPPSGGSSLVSN